MQPAEEKSSQLSRAARRVNGL